MPASLHTHGLWSLSDTECSYDCVLGSGHQLTMGVWKVWDRAPCVLEKCSCCVRPSTRAPMPVLGAQLKSLCLFLTLSFYITLRNSIC